MEKMQMVLSLHSINVLSKDLLKWVNKIPSEDFNRMVRNEAEVPSTIVKKIEIMTSSNGRLENFFKKDVEDLRL